MKNATRYVWGVKTKISLHASFNFTTEILYIYMKMCVMLVLLSIRVAFLLPTDLSLK